MGLRIMGKTKMEDRYRQQKADSMGSFNTKTSESEIQCC